MLCMFDDVTPFCNIKRTRCAPPLARCAAAGAGGALLLLWSWLARGELCIEFNRRIDLDLCIALNRRIASQIYMIAFVNTLQMKS